MQEIINILFNTEIPFKIKGAIPGGYSIYKDDNYSYFYIIFCWKDRKINFNYDCNKIINAIGNKDIIIDNNSNVKFRKGNGFLYYSHKNVDLWDYCLYTSVSCRKDNKNYLNDIEKVLVSVLNIKKIINKNKIKKDILRKKLKELIDIGVVREYNEIVDEPYQKLIENYLSNTTLTKEQKNLLLSIEA